MLQPAQAVEDKELLTEAKASALVQVRQSLDEHPQQVSGSEGTGCCRIMTSELAVSLPDRVTGAPPWARQALSRLLQRRELL